MEQLTTSSYNNAFGDCKDAYHQSMANATVVLHFNQFDAVLDADLYMVGM